MVRLKLLGQQFTLQQDNDPKHIAKATKFTRAKKCNVFDLPSQHAKDKIEGKNQQSNKQELKMAAIFFIEV